MHKDFTVQSSEYKICTQDKMNQRGDGETGQYTKGKVAHQRILEMSNWKTRQQVCQINANSKVQ